MDNNYSCALVVNKQHSDGTQSEVIKIPVALQGLSATDVSYLRYLLSTGVANPVIEFQKAVKEGKFDKCPKDTFDYLTYIVQSTAKYWENADSASVLDIAISMVCDVALGNILVNTLAASRLDDYLTGNVKELKDDEACDADIDDNLDGESLDEELEWKGVCDDGAVVETTSEPEIAYEFAEQEMSVEPEPVPEPVIEEPVVSTQTLEAQKQARVDLDERTQRAPQVDMTERPAAPVSDLSEDDYIAESDFDSNDFLDEQPEPVRPVDRLEEDIDKIRVSLPSRESREARKESIPEPVVKTSEPEMPLRHEESAAAPMPVRAERPTVEPLPVPDRFNTGRMPLHREAQATPVQSVSQFSSMNDAGRVNDNIKVASVASAVPEEDYDDADMSYMTSLFAPDEIEDDSDGDI